MSTDYKIVETKDVVLSVDEGSNKFDITLFSKDTEDMLQLEDLTTHELIEVAVRILRVASYWGVPHHDNSLIRDAGRRALDYSIQLPPLTK